jgi:hypothetical protein
MRGRLVGRAGLLAPIARSYRMLRLWWFQAIATTAHASYIPKKAIRIPQK